MNILKIHTLATGQSDTFNVYWSNSGFRPGGLLKVRITAPIEDRHIAAELAAMQHLLEVKCVLGHKLVGNAGTQLVISLGAIRKLHRRQSDKVHLAPFANFLTTRFAGCRLKVDKDSAWFDGFQPDSIEDLLVTGPIRETLKVTGLGKVCVTQHVLERFADRFLAGTEPAKAVPAAWKNLVALASDASVREVVRDSLWGAARYSSPGRQEGRYFLNAKRNLVLVVTDHPKQGKRLVTTYPATRHFRDMPRAA
jgi:hypothetical protein